MILDPTSDIASNDVAAIDIGFTSDASGIYVQQRVAKGRLLAGG